MGDSETKKKKKGDKNGQEETLKVFGKNKMRECLVNGCPYQYDQKLKIKPYSLPKDPDLRALWVGFASLSGPVKIMGQTGICKAHFREDQFVLSDLLKANYGFLRKEPRLKEGAVPTLLSEEIRKRVQQSWTKPKEKRNWKGVMGSLSFAADRVSTQPKDSGVKLEKPRRTPNPMRTPTAPPEMNPEPMKNPLGEGYAFSVGDFCVRETAPPIEATWFDEKPSAGELAMASQAATKNPLGEGYDLSVGDFCVPESAPTQEATWFDKKPSLEELAMASQAAMAFGEAAQELTVPPVPLSIQSTLQDNTGGTSPTFQIKNEPISDSEEPTFSTTNPPPQVEEVVPTSQLQESAPPIIVSQFQSEEPTFSTSNPQFRLGVSSPDLQGNTSSLSGSALPPEVQIVRPPWEGNAISSGLLHPDGQPPMQQSQENVQTAGETHESVMKKMRKKILAMHREKFPSSTAKQIQIQKTDKGIVAIVLGPKDIKKPATISVPKKAKKTSTTKTKPSQPKPKRKKQKSKHLTKVVPEEEAEEGWEEVNKDDEGVLRKEVKREADGEELNKEDEFRRAAEKECAQSMLESNSDGGFHQGNEAEMEAAETVEKCAQLMEGDEQVHDIEDDEEEVMEEEEYEEEDYEEEGADNSKDSDYDPFDDIQQRNVKKKKHLGKPVTELEVSSSECSVSSFNSDEEEEENREKKKQKTRRKRSNHLSSVRFSLSGNERRKHILKLQLAKTKQLRLECKLCKDSFFTVQDFQLHFEEKHPGEAEKLVTDLVLTLERKRIAFGEQKEKEAQERKDQLMLKMKKLEEMMGRGKKREKTAQKQKAAQEKKMRLEKMAECELQPRKSARLGLIKAKTAIELLGLKCENSGNKSRLLETQSSITKPELDPKHADVPTNDQSNQQDTNDASMKESELQTEEENGTKVPTEMTFEETEPQREKENEDTSTKMDITMQETEAQREKENEDAENQTEATMQETGALRDEVNEDTQDSMNAILQEIDQRDKENERITQDKELEKEEGNIESNAQIDTTMRESDAQRDSKDNGDNNNPTDATTIETYALRVEESEHALPVAERENAQGEEHQTDEQETETSNEPQTAKSDLVAKSSISCENVREHEPIDSQNGCNNEQLVHAEHFETVAKTDNKIEAGYTTEEKVEKLQSPTNLESVRNASEPTTLCTPENICEKGGTLDNSASKQSDPSETFCNQDVQSEHSEQANNTSSNDTHENVHKYEARGESNLGKSTDARNLDKSIDGRVGKLDNGDEASKFVTESEAEHNEMQSDVRSPAYADGGSIAHQSEPMSNEPTSMDGVLPGDDDAEVVIDSVEPEEVEFVPEVDEDVIFELDAWSNILLKCTKCSSFIEFWRYTTHLNEHDVEKKTCEICGKEYCSKSLYEHHKRCLGKREYGVCEICGKYVANVKSHLRASHEKHTFACKICNATFRTKSKLNRHIQVHSSVKEHVCEICGRSFSQSGNLKGHMRQHTQEKPYKCDMCEKSFVHNVSLKTHQKRDHGMDPWMGANTAAVGRRKKERDDSSENTAKKRRTPKKKTDEGSSDETAVKRKRGRKKK